MKTTDRNGEEITTLSLYNDEQANEVDLQGAMRFLMAAFHHEKDAEFWALVYTTLNNQHMTKQQLKDTVEKASENEFLTIKSLKPTTKQVRMYSREQALWWFNNKISGTASNHMLKYFYIYPKEQTNNMVFYSLWSDLAKEGVNVEPLKRRQANEFGYKL